jgi:predicted acetyltransferase
MLALYPFRPDFYKKMGFGYGAKINLYRIKPGDLPRGDSKENIVYATKKDVPALKDCYHRFTARTHGMMKRTIAWGPGIFQPENKVVAVKKRGRIEGFMIFSFKTSTDENWLAVEMVISEFIYENREALVKAEEI